MFAIARSLVWKEWREQRWRVLALTAIVLSISTWFAVGGRITIVEAAIPALYMVLPFAAMFLAMSAAASEQSSGTVGFLQALPISPARYGATKLVGSIVVLLTPVVTAFVIFISVGVPNENVPNGGPGPWSEFTTWLAALLVFAAGLVSVFLWTAACGLNQKDEVRAGAIGFLAVSAIWLLLIAVPLAFVDDPDVLPGWRVLVAGAPGGPFVAFIDIQRNAWEEYGLPLAWCLVVHGVLTTLFVKRYARLTRGGVKPADAKASLADELTVWLAPPRRSPLTALVWKQYRESLPLAALGSGLIVIYALIAFREFNNFNVDVKLLVIQLWSFVSVFTCLVAGVGAFMEDYQPGVPAFWRSRPIPLRKYFTVKYLGGLAITLLTLSIAPLVLLGLGTYLFGTTRDPTPVQQTYSMILSVVPMQIGIYTAASASFVLSRRPLPTALLAIGSVWLISLAIGELVPSLPKAESSLIFLSVPPILAGISLAYHAFRNDWGWRK